MTSMEPVAEDDSAVQWAGIAAPVLATGGLTCQCLLSKEFEVRIDDT